MKNKKLFIGVFLILIFFSLLLLKSTNVLLFKCLLISLIIIFIISITLLATSSEESIKDKLVKTLLENFDTAYVMINKESKKCIYVSKSLYEILGIKNDYNIDVYKKIFSIPIIKEQVNSWDKVSEYLSGFLRYYNPNYNHEMWIKIKIVPFIENKTEYYILQIIDATKEHEHQHMLVSQASNIKNRENILNQVAHASYDFEININLLNETYRLDYYKKDNLYFGESKSGKYIDGLGLFSSYVNSKDKNLFLNKFNLDNLNEHFEKYELNSDTVRYRVGNEDKNNIWLESTIFYTLNKGKREVIVLTKNVTESAESIRNQNVMLQNALNEAKMLNKSKTDMLSMISHDIREPLMNIIGISDDLIDKKIDNNILEDIKNINTSSKDLLGVVDNMLDPDKVEKNIIKKESVEYNIFDLFKDIEEETKEYINEDIKIDFNLDNNLPILLYGDKKRIKSSIIKILNNSIKYTSEGKISVNVRGLKEKGKVNLVIEIYDTGCGIKEENLNNIVKTKSTNSLSQVKDVIDLLGGSLEIESKENEYTKVTISFKQKIVEDNKIGEMLKNKKTINSINLDGKRVLVVDDNKLNLKVTKKLLDTYNLDVALVESGEECLGLLEENSNYDLIFMDQMMPGLNGSDTLNKIREKGLNIPIVVLTADALKGKREKYLNIGFDDYISKPIDKKELNDILNKFLNK